MRVVSRKAIIDFYTKHSDSKIALEEWYLKITKCSSENLNELKKLFNSVDYVGNNRYVFNIKGNDYRLVVIIIFLSQKVYIRFIGSHAEYDKVDVKTV